MIETSSSLRHIDRRLYRLQRTFNNALAFNRPRFQSQVFFERRSIRLFSKIVNWKCQNSIVQTDYAETCKAVRGSSSVFLFRALFPSPDIFRTLKSVNRVALDRTVLGIRCFRVEHVGSARSIESLGSGTWDRPTTCGPLTIRACYDSVQRVKYGTSQTGRSRRYDPCVWWPKATSISRDIVEQTQKRCPIN